MILEKDEYLYYRGKKDEKDLSEVDSSRYILHASDLIYIQSSLVRNIKTNQICPKLYLVDISTGNLISLFSATKLYSRYYIRVDSGTN